MPRRAITEGDCTNCESEQAELSVTDSGLRETEDELSQIKYDVRCSECGEESVIIVDEEGTHAGEGVTHDDASWNSDTDGSEAAA